MADLIVVPDSLHAVIGRNIIQALGLLINGATFQVCSATTALAPVAALQNVANTHPTLLDGSLGTYPDISMS